MERESSHEGIVFLGEDLEPTPATILVEDGIIRKIEEENVPKQYWILPALFNAHTHIGDTVAMDIPIKGDLSAIVAPPDGIKHRILRATNKQILIAAMRATINFLQNTGCAGFADFREGGVFGVDALREAAEGARTRPLIFGRDGGELSADGFGISSVRDIEDLDRQVEEARRQGRMIAIHAGEQDDQDIEGALAYDPDLLIHCTHARDRDLRYCAEADIPIAICPGSNWILRVTGSPAFPPVKKMIDYGCRVFLGTDNTMFVQPDIWREMSFLSTISDIPAHTILQMGIAGSILTQTPYWIEEGNTASFIEIDSEQYNLRYSRDFHRTLVSRIGPCHIDRILF